VQLQTAAGDTRSVAVNQQLLARYRAGQPWREPPARPSNGK
jgi:hypothetical protein